MGNDSPPSPDLSPILATAKSSFSVIKEVLPWLVVLYNLIFGFGVKQSTSDQNLRLLLEDHATLELLRTQQNESMKQQASTAAKVEMLVTMQGQHNAR